MISLRPSLITEHHSVSSLNDPAREASPCSRFLRPARDVDTTCTVGASVHESTATRVRAHRALNLIRGCVGRSDRRALAQFGPMAIRQGDKAPLELSRASAPGWEAGRRWRMDEPKTGPKTPRRWIPRPRGDREGCERRRRGAEIRTSHRPRTEGGPASGRGISRCGLSPAPPACRAHSRVRASSSWCTRSVSS